MTTPLKRQQQGPHSYLTGGEGPPLLLLHGIPGSAYIWAQAGAELADQFRVIIPDLRGFGRSAPPDGDYYMAAQARSLHDFLRALGIDSLFIGAHDFGAPVTFTMMRLFPQLHVRGLVVTATNLFTDTYVPPPLRLAPVPVLGSLFYKLMAGNRLGLRMLHWAATRNKAAAPWRQFKRHLTGSGIELTQRIFHRSIADLHGNYIEIEQMLPTITQPTLVLWGDSDPLFATAVAERSHQAIPGSSLKIYAQTGHFVPEERPFAVAADVASFLAGIDDT